jgi:hypothetical protein
VAGGDADRGGDLVGGLGEADDRRLAGRDAGVSAVEGELERFGPNPCRTESDPEVGEQRTVVDARSLVTVSIRSTFAHQED